MVTLTEKTKDRLTWLLVALWLVLGAVYVAACRDKDVPINDPFPLRTAHQDAPRPTAPQVIMP